MANLEKHVKARAVEVAEAEFSLVPTRARGVHLVGRYIKGRRGEVHVPRRPVKPSVAPFVVRLEGVPATPATQERFRKRVEEINRQLRGADVPVRLRVLD